MSNKQNDNLEEQLFENIGQSLQELENNLRYWMTYFGSIMPDKTYKTRQALKEDFHNLQALLDSPEVKKEVEKQEKKDPSEGTVDHPDHGKEVDQIYKVNF